MARHSVVTQSGRALPAGVTNNHSVIGPRAAFSRHLISRRPTERRGANAAFSGANSLLSRHGSDVAPFACFAPLFFLLYQGMSKTPVAIRLFPVILGPLTVRHATVERTHVVDDIRLLPVSSTFQREGKCGSAPAYAPQPSAMKFVHQWVFIPPALDRFNDCGGSLVLAAFQEAFDKPDAVINRIRAAHDQI